MGAHKQISPRWEDKVAAIIAARAKGDRYPPHCS
jgi:hypothetical protein